MTPTASRMSEILQRNEAELVNEWVAEQRSVLGHERIRELELREQCTEFIHRLREAMQHGDPGSLRGPAWDALKDLLGDVSRSRGRQGFSPSETASFIFALKNPLFNRLRHELGKDANTLVQEVLNATVMLDKLGLYTSEVYLKAREEVIARQQMDMLELSTPVVRLWDGILALPIIGTLDSARSQVVMESLLTQIVTTGSPIAILDITGVPTVDTLTAQHLLKTVTAARLMGAECIISGIRPQIAQTIVQLGVDLQGVTTKASLADAFAMALQRLNLTVARQSAAK